MKTVALITGASSGIGREFAAIHAERGGDLVIVARSADKLAAVKNELESKHSIQATVISKDLSLPDSAQQIYDEVNAAGIKVDYLINNAGFGGHGKFHEREWSDDLAMIQLNVVTLTALCRLFLPDFVTPCKRSHPQRLFNSQSSAGPVAGCILRHKGLRYIP